MHPNNTAPHILVANHAPRILELVRELLEAEGFLVTTQPREGQHIDRIAELAPDLIITDYMWPQTDNEWTLLNLLTIDRRTHHIPAVLCTGAVTEARDFHTQ